MRLNISNKPAYEKLKFYQDICEIRRTIHKITSRFSKMHLRLISQMRDASRSAKQNIKEGYRRESAGEFAHSIRISQGSLEELKGDIEDCFEDGLINKSESDKLFKLIHSADYMSNRYLLSLNKMKNDKTWRTPFTKSK